MFSGLLPSIFVAHMLFAAVIVAVTVGMAVAPEIRGSDDYPFYLTTVPFITVLLFFGVSSLYSDIYVSVYIRTSRLYKCLRTRAVQVFLLIMSVVALIPAIIVTAVVNPSALPDFLLISAIIIGISLPLASTYFLMWIVFFGYSIFNLIPGFFGDHFMVKGFKFLPTELSDSLPVAGVACSGDTACRAYSFIYRVGYYFPHKKASS